MAVALESFSIREYTAKMRSVDFGKCWPFDGDGKRDGEMGRSLPPISFRKFRWWFDELEETRSAGEKPDGGAVWGFEMERTGALPAEEGRQMKTSVKVKQRAPKKRSIVELFAVSPQIGAVEDESDGCDGLEGKGGAIEDEEREKERGGEEIGREESLGGGDGGCGTDGRVSSPRKRKERVKEIQKKKKMAKKSWMKYKSKKKKKLKVDICAAKTEKNYRAKTSCSGDISQLLQDSVCKKRLRRALRDSVDTRKKKPSTVKSLLKKQNCKLIRDSKLLFKKQEAGKVLPIHGILKNHTKASSIKKSSLIGNTQGGSSFKPSCVSEKHVTFSGKDDILGHSKGFSPLELPQLQNLCKIFSDVLAASSARGDLGKSDKLPPPSKGAQVVNDSENDGVASGAEGISGGGKRQLTDANSHAVSHEFINPNNGTCLDRVGKVVDLNSVIQSSSNSNCVHSGNSGFSASHVYSGKQQVHVKEGSTFDEGIHSDERTKQNLPTPIESGISSSEVISSLTVTRNLLSQPSTTCSVMSAVANERQPDLSVGPRIHVDRCASEIQPMHFIAPKNLRCSICTSVGSRGSGETRLVSDQMPICKDKCIDGDFIGLPLNSQGELIKLHSSGKFGFRDLFKHQNTVLGSCRSFPVSNLVQSRSNMDHMNMRGKFPVAPLYMKDQLRWYPEQCNNPASFPVTSGLGVMQLNGFERMEVPNHVAARDKEQHFHHGPNSIKVSCYGCREHNLQDHNLNNWEKFQADGNLNHGVQPAHQPTMRLMGKNVTVGKSSEECRNFDDGKIWTDKEIISEHNPSVRLSDASLPSQWFHQEWFKHPASEASRLLQPLESSSSICRSPAVKPRYDHVDFDRQERWISRNGLSSTMRNHGSMMNPSSHPPPPQTMINKTSNHAVNSATDYVEVGHQIPFVATPQNISQHMLLMSTQCKHSQSFSFSTSSISHPAYLSQNCGNFVESSSVHSSLHHPEWLLNAEQCKKINKSSFPLCSDPIGIHHPCTTSGSKLPLLPYMYPTSIMSFPVYNTSSSHTCGSTPVVHSPFIPVYSASKTTFAGNGSFRNKIKHRVGTKSKLTYLKSLDRASKSNKRPAAKYDGFMKPAKKPHLTVQDHSNVPVGPRREQLNGCSSDDAGTPKISALANKIIDGLPVTSNEKNVLTISSASSSLNLSGGTRLGPVKLSAGAKHILKPSQNMDQDNARPIHSTIPFAVGTSCSTAPVSQKSATIYRF